MMAECNEGLPEQTLDIPSSLLGFKSGFTLDYGSSLLKIIYVTDLGDQVRLHLVSYPCDRLEESLDFIKDKISNSLIPGQEVVLTGVGVGRYTELIENKLNIRIKLASEFQHYVEGLLFLTQNFPLCEIIHPLSSEVKDHVDEVSKQWVNLIRSASKACSDKIRIPPSFDNIEDIQLQPGDHEKVTYPIVFMLGGSASDPFLIHEDGSFDWMDVNPIAGRTLLGLCSLMAGTKSFREAVELAEKGDPKLMHHYFNQIIVKSKKDSYDGLDVDLNLFAMAGSIGKSLDDFSREDRAAAAVSLVTTSLGHYFASWAKTLKQKQVFFIGGMFTNKLIRDQIAKVFVFQSVTDQMGVHPQPLFVKLGAYCAALGALLANRKSEP